MPSSPRRPIEALLLVIGILVLASSRALSAQRLFADLLQHLFVDLVAGLLFIGPFYYATVRDYAAPAVYLVGTLVADVALGFPLLNVVVGPLLQLTGYLLGLWTWYRYSNRR